MLDGGAPIVELETLGREIRLTTAATVLKPFSQNILAVRLLIYVILANASRSDLAPVDI
jgi:hypothetical protein